MRSWLSMKNAFAAVFLLAAIGQPSAAHAERWWGSSDVCLDLDSVHIFSGNDGARYVSYRQKLCAGSGILLWAVAAKDCDRLRANDTSVDLYVYKEDDGKWVNMMDYFNYPIDLDEQYNNAGVACNWAFPKFP